MAFVKHVDGELRLHGLQFNKTECCTCC